LNFTIIFTIASVAMLVMLAPTAQAARIESTNAVTSAPLNIVNRSFARLQRQLDRDHETERLSYRAPRTGDKIHQIANLLINLGGGPSEVHIKEIAPVDARLAQQAADSFFAADSRMNTSIRTDRFVAATKAALARNDVHLFSARVVQRTGEARILILIDDETRELIVVSISRRQP
jgi:hypothetical protein